MVLISSQIGMDRTRTSADAEATRLHWIDTAKGVGILFVVFGHAWRGAFHAGILRDDALFRLIDGMIYAWHMPLFFFLSGLLFLDAIRTSAAAPFVRARVERLLWPMALWTWIFFGIKLAVGNAANHPVAMADFPLIPLPPYEHLWFLWALFLAQMLVFAVFAPITRALSDGAIRLAAGGMALALVLLIPQLYVPSRMFGAAVEHFPYFLAGLACGGLAYLHPPAWIGAGAALLFAIGLYDPGDHWASLLRSLALTALLCLALAWADRNAAEPGPAIAVLRRLGYHSLAIFLAHTIFSAAFRIGMLKAGIDSLALHLVVATAVGLVGPLMLLHLSRKLRITGVLGI